MEYTKGEWYWEEDNKGNLHNLRSKNGNEDKHILFVGMDFLGQFSFENQKANAQLISAAPNMYKVLQGIKRVFEDNPWQRTSLWYEDMEKALAKAEGE